MLNKVLKKLKNIFYYLQFGLKGADNEIFGKSNTNDGNGVSINQKMESNKLSDSLMKGEVTQEVEELRYRTYKVAKESQNYNYLGDGIAIKEKNNKLPDVFYIRNHIICEGVTHELNRIDDYSIDRYILKVEYSDIPRFKVERFCNYVKVDLRNNELSLFFEKNTNDPHIRMFHNELEKKGDSLKSDVFNYPKNMKFFTNDTFNEFYFINKISSTFRNEELQYIISYKFEKYTIRDIVKENYSKSMDEKYSKKEKKNNIADISNLERTRICSSCGKEINTYDGDITSKTYGYPLCEECLKKLKEVNYD